MSRRIAAYGSVTLPNIPGPLGVRLPANWGVLSGQTVQIWWRGVAFLRTLDGYTFEARGPGSFNAARWEFSPTEVDVGTRNLTIEVRDATGAVVSRATTKLHVLSASGHSGTFHDNPGPGDSIKAAVGAWPNTVKTIIESTGAACVMYGFFAGSGAGVRHDAQAGSTHWWHNREGSPIPGKGPYADGGAAHLAANGQGRSAYDVGDKNLGTNDYAAQRGPIPGPYHPEDFEVVLQDSRELVSKMQAACDRVIVWPAYNCGEGDRMGTSYGADRFEANRRIGVNQEFDEYADREDENLYMGAPLHAACDPAADFPAPRPWDPDIDGPVPDYSGQTIGDVHPNTFGQAKLAAMAAGHLLWVRSRPVA